MGSHPRPSQSLPVTCTHTPPCHVLPTHLPSTSLLPGGEPEARSPQVFSPVCRMSSGQRLQDPSVSDLQIPQRARAMEYLSWNSCSSLSGQSPCLTGHFQHPQHPQPISLFMGARTQWAQVAPVTTSSSQVRDSGIVCTLGPQDSGTWQGDAMRTLMLNFT